MPRDIQEELESMCYKGDGPDGMTPVFETNTKATGTMAGKVFHIRGGSGVEETELQWLVARHGGFFAVDGMVFSTFHCGSYGGLKDGRAIDYVVGGKKATRTMEWVDFLDMAKAAAAAAAAVAVADSSNRKRKRHTRKTR